jgi:repressor of nif and glnA expression
VNIPVSSCIVPNLVLSVLDRKEPMSVREIAERIRRIHGCAITYQSIHYHLAKMRRKGGVVYVHNRGWTKRIATGNFEELVDKLTRA